jgi:hypothetical protein
LLFYAIIAKREIAKLYLSYLEQGYVMPTFINLLKNLKKNCDCLKFGITPNTSDIFSRRGKNIPPKLSDFLSYFEEKKPLKPKPIVQRFATIAEFQ